MSIELRAYQDKFYTDIVKKCASTSKIKIVGVLPTGGGKSVIIGKLATSLGGRTLILTHRIEILMQNSEWLNGCGLLSSSINTLRYDSKVVIAMVQTLHSRLNTYGMKYVGDFDNIILDEIHILIFEKVFKKYNYKRLIGFTGTPVLNKKKYTTVHGVEYVEQYTLSEIFDTMIQGPDSQDLIDAGYLVQDFNVVLKLPDFDKLKESNSNPDGYTTKSLNDVYINTASYNILNEAYDKYCTGKKTLIFNASTKINEFVYKNFKRRKLNVKMFDSVNSVEINPDTGNNYTRGEIIKWFKDEKDAILINTNVFTTGFDVSDVEVVVVNRATKSLALWIQMVGRGSRNTTKIFKDKFTVIDLGQNIYEHGTWSKRRNWNDYFYSRGKIPKKRIDMLSTWTCAYCGALTVVGELKCCVCGKDRVKKETDNTTSNKKLKEGELSALEAMPLPNAKSILKYVRSINENGNFAFRLLDEKIIELFLHYKVTKDYYNVQKDRFYLRVKQIYTPIYFALIKSGLPCKNRRLDTQINKLLTKIENII